MRNASNACSTAISLLRGPLPLKRTPAKQFSGPHRILRLIPGPAAPIKSRSPPAGSHRALFSHLPTHVKGLLITGFGVLVMTPDGLLVRLVDADEWTLLFWRGLLAGIGMAIGLTLIYRGKTWALIRQIGWAGLITGIIFGIGTCAFIMGITHTSVANTLFLVSTSPLFAAVFAWLVLREPVALRTWLAIAVTILGIGVIVSGGLDWGSMIGNLAALAAAMTLAVNLCTMRHYQHRNMVPAMGIGGFVAALIALPLAAPLSISQGDVGVLALMGLVMVPLSFGLLFVGPRYLPAPEVGLMMLLEAVLGPFWVWWALGENPGTAAIVGGAIVLGALAMNAWLSLREERRQTRSSP